MPTAPQDSTEDTQELRLHLSPLGLTWLMINIMFTHIPLPLSLFIITHIHLHLTPIVQAVLLQICFLWEFFQTSCLSAASVVRLVRSVQRQETPTVTTLIWRVVFPVLWKGCNKQLRMSSSLFRPHFDKCFFWVTHHNDTTLLCMFSLQKGEKHKA